MPDLPTGTVTFLFTDIEGSTRLLEAQPREYRDALARHDAILERAIAERGGTIFQRAGDGVCAAFVSPTEAVGAAFDGQRALHREPWPADRPIRVRMGLHTGAAEIQGAQYFGLTLHRCSRLMSAAHGGQVLLSNATAALVAGDLPHDVTLKDLGEHRLRDLAQPERVKQLCGPDVPADFPPLRTLTAIPNNLPVQRTAFIGREQQRRAVREIVLRPDTRLVTLTGPGGTGKTRLGLEAAGDLLDSFEDGVFFVPLAPVTDPDLVLPATAQALGIRETPGRSVDALLADLLGPKRCLLLLDNFEQVVAAAPLLADLIAASPHLKILVTSRAVLRLYGEREYVVPPLSLPDRRAAPTAVHLAQFEAIRLFQDRAQAARADFAVADENAADVAEICQRLDGLPLAIELAAARIRTLTPQAMLQRMARRLPLLTGGARDLPARQRTLRDTIAWSYDLLDPDERVLFRRLGVFRGCTLEAAESVCRGDPPRPGATSVALPLLEIDVLDGVESLLEKSLLQQDRGFDGQPRYRMLETIREYALEQLETSGEASATQRRHVLEALRLVEAAEPELHGAGQVEWLARLEQEHDNLREALRWCEEHGYAEPALRLATALWLFWSAHGHIAEGRERLEALLARFPIRPSSQRAALGGRALFAAAALATIQGDLVQARSRHDEALTLRRAIGDPEAIIGSLEGLGQVAGLQGDHAAARAYLEEALAISRAERNEYAEMSILWNLGVVAHEAGDRETARAYYLTSIALNQDISADEDEVGAYLSLARLDLEQGQLDAAERQASEALSGYRRWGHPRLEALALATLGGIALARDDLGAAREHLSASIASYQALGDIASIAQVLDRFVELAAAYGRHEDAARLAGSATALRERAGALRSPEGQEKLNEALGPARRALGAEAADAAWQNGRALAVDEAVAAALAIAEPVAVTAVAPAPVPDPSLSTLATVLSPREREVATLIARGLTNRQIADALVITEGTVANHVNHIFNKLGCTSRAQIAVWASENGLTASQRSDFAHQLTGGAPHIEGISGAKAERLVAAGHDAFIYGLSNAMTLSVGIAIAGVLVAFFLIGNQAESMDEETREAGEVAEAASPVA